MASKFQKGQSGNPAGRPRGSKNRSTLLAMAALEGELDAVVRKVIDAAKAGDMTAARLVVDKLIPAAKERPLNISLPVITDAAGCANAQAQIIATVAAGDLLPGEGEALASLIEHHRRAIETTDITRRLEALEAKEERNP